MMADCAPKTLKVDDVEYVRKDSVQERPPGNRAVVVVDRGWIFAGDVEEKSDRIILTLAVWVFRWESIGFDGVIANPKNSNATLKVLANPVEIPTGSEIFRVPVSKDWGL